jgi:hypothetical protein
MGQIRNHKANQKDTLRQMETVTQPTKIYGKAAKTVQKGIYTFQHHY